MQTPLAGPLIRLGVAGIPEVRPLHLWAVGVPQELIAFRQMSGVPARLNTCTVMELVDEEPETPAGSVHAYVVPGLGS